ncbi:MAG: CinA family protein [Ardenticatenales bacterium]|nr:CinA family protein [Ardenticatenales bacterium]
MKPGHRSVPAPLARSLIDRATVAGMALAQRGRRLATAESCTGGLIGAAVTAVPGCSAWYVGGVISYADRAKHDLLDVPMATLEAHGAVSAETAAAMATGALARLGADIAVSVTGIAGPEGGSADKPVGLVWFGLATAEGVTTWSTRTDGDRAAVRTAAAAAALDAVAALLSPPRS